MANQILTIGMITREILRILVNSLTFTRQINRSYDDKFGIEGAKIGSVVNVRKPVRYVNASGQGLVLQDVTETSVPVALTTQYQRSFIFTAADLKLSVDDFSKRFVRPAVASMANQIDFDGLGLYNTIYDTVGTPGSAPNTVDTYLQAGVVLDNQAAPRDGERCVVINPQMNATIVSAMKGLFNPQRDISEQTRKGMMAEDTLGLDWYMDQNVHVHTVGPQGGTPLVTSAPATGATQLVSKGWTASAASRLNLGDVFTIGTSATSSDAVLAVNPQSRQSTGALAQFVVTAPFSSDGSGNGTINVSPAFYDTGAFQNINQLPAANAPINVLGSAGTQSPQGLAFHPDAFTFATADLPLPDGVDMRDRVSSKDVGLSIRLIRAYDINTDRFPLRLDLLGGWATLYPELACRIAS